MSDYVDTNPVGLELQQGLDHPSTSATSNHGNNPHNNNNNNNGGSSNTNDLLLPPPPPPPPPAATRLTAKPHGFAGAVLSPKHARDLNPTLCMAIASSLAEQQQQPPPSASSGGGGSSSASGKAGSVPYTLWITEAWRVLGWAEPSAALFWEIATMYHTLQVANRDHYCDPRYAHPHSHGFRGGGGGGSHHQHGSLHSPSPSHLQQQQQQQYSRHGGGGGGFIPPILSCGSTSSMTSGATSTAVEKQKKFSSAVSAKELPVWLVGTFLLLHCEEFACQRSLSGEDERRFAPAVYSSSAAAAAAGAAGALMLEAAPTASRMDFSSLFRHQGLSPRTRLHAGWNNDNTHCAAFLLRHLRKILVLSAVSHNPDALVACMHLAALPAPPEHGLSETSTTNPNNWRVKNTAHGKQYSANDIRRQHDDEHESVGLQVRLTMEDLERLDLIFQPPAGGGIDDPPLKIGEFLWQSMYQDPPPPMASIPLGDVERELRQHLEMELSLAMGSDDNNVVSSDEEDSATNALARMTLKDNSGGGGGAGANNTNNADDDEGDDGAATQPDNQYQKELNYTRLRGTTIMLKPNAAETSSGAASVASGEPPNSGNMFHVVAGRLHDLVISDCTDAHFYLLQPFEHATIAACTGCTIVVGAVAGLLHVVDCEKTVITSAARRILVSNSCDVQMCVFTPTQPILVGDNRSCQFAPYNTYYDGLREDLLASGLGAAVLPENLQASRNTTEQSEWAAAAWPPLQCASSKWKQPIEVSKLEVPQGPGSPVPNSPGGAAPLSPGADDKAMASSGNDVTMQAPVLVPPSDFQILFVPIESDASAAARQRKTDSTEDENEAPEDSSAISTSGNSSGGSSSGIGSQYCKHLTEVLQLSPFRLPPEYERRALIKAERMKNIQLKVQKHLNAEQQKRFEEELNRGFRDWLVTSGNLRQVLDLVHLEVKNAS